MALLEYNFKIIGTNAIDQALGSIERRVAQHNAIVTRQLGTGKRGTPVARPGALAAPRIRVVDVTARAEQRAALQTERYWQTAARRSADMRIRMDEKAHRQRMQQIMKEQRAENRAAATATRTMERERRNVRRSIVGTAGRSVAGTLGAVGTYAGAALGLAGTFAMGSALQTEVANRGKAAEVAIQGRQPGARADVLRQAEGIKGFTTAESLEALQNFTTPTGDLDAARASLGSLSTLALATGSNFGELAAAAGEAFNVIRDTIKDPAQQMRALNEVMGALAAQGNLGKIEIRDMATELAGLGSATRYFAGDPVDLLKSIGAMAQTAAARGGASSPAEATTAVVRFATDIQGKTKEFQQLTGKSAFTDKSRTKLRGPQDLMLDLLEGSKGDLVKIQSVFGERGVRAVQGFSPLFTEAEKQKKGSGRAAVEAEFARYTGASRSAEQLQQDAAVRLGEPDKQFLQATKEFNTAIGAKLLPVVTQLIPKFADMIPELAKATESFAKFVAYVADNPLKGLGAVIAGKVALDLASAGIGSIVRSGFEKILSSIPIPGLGGTGGAGVGPGKGAGGALAVGAAAFGVGLAIDQGVKLAEQTSGFEGILAGIGGFLSGDGFAKGVSTYQDAKAYERDDAVNWLERARRESTPQGEFGTRALPEGMAVQNSRGERVDFASLPPEQQQQLLESAGALKEAAGAIKAASAELGATRPLNRGNTPAPPVP